MVNLTLFSLRDNKLTGALWYVPSYHTTNWLLIWVLFSGSIPVELGQLLKLERLELWDNQLTGALWYRPSYHTSNWLLIWLLFQGAFLSSLLS